MLVPACTLTSLLIRNAAEARQVLGGVGQVPRYSGWVSCLRSVFPAVRAQRVGRDFGLFFCFLVVLVELFDHHASRDEDVDHDQAEVDPSVPWRWPTGSMAVARRGAAPPQPATPGCRLPAAGGRGQLRGPRRGSSAPSQRRGDAVEDMAARGGGRSAAPLLTIGDELGTNGGAPPVVEHPRLDLQRAPPERLAEHVESERLGGAVAGEGQSAHRCRGAMVVRRKIRGRLARAPTRTPPSPWAPRPSAPSIAAAIATLGCAGWRSGGAQRGRSGAIA